MLIALGMAAFGYRSKSYTVAETGINLGAIPKTVEKTRTVPLRPIVGGICLAGGIALLIIGRKKRFTSADE